MAQVFWKNHRVRQRKNNAILIYFKHSIANFSMYIQMFADVNPYLFCNSEEATSVMVELLRTYTDENASEVKDDAKNCIVSLLGRPNVLIMDFLLTLPPVAALQGEPIYQVQSC